MDNNQKNFSISKRQFIRIIQSDITNHYEVIKKIGEGSYGKIYKAKNKISNELRAMKQMEKSKIKNLQTFKNEIEILSKMDHPNIIKLFEVYEDPKYFYLINDLCTGGELLNKILNKKKETPFNEKEAVNIFKQLVSAISYCHNINIVHRDLKPENILFVNDDINSPIKIIDFGFSQEFKNNNNINNNGNGKNSKDKNMSSKVGTVYYMSPEILQGNYNELCDIWSLGVILYIILCGYAPFQGKNDQEIYKSIQNGKVDFSQKEWKTISKNAKELILHMLCPANKRYSAKQVLKHVWLNNKNINEKFNELSVNIDSLVQYKDSNKLRKIILIFIAFRLKDEEIKNIKQNFSFFDKEKKGVINYQDFKYLFEKLTANNEEYKDLKVDEIFKSIDINNSGKIDYTEFLAATIEKNLYLKDEYLKEAFDSFDCNLNGKISVSDIKQTLNLQDNNEYDPIINQWIKENDFDDDNELNFNEFKKMMSLNEI